MPCSGCSVLYGVNPKKICFSTENYLFSVLVSKNPSVLVYISVVWFQFVCGIYKYAYEIEITKGNY